LKPYAVVATSPFLILDLEVLVASIFRRKEKTHPGDLTVEFKQTGTDALGEPVYAEVLALEPLSIGGGGAPAAVTIVDGGDVAQGTTTDAAWTTGAGTVISLLKKIASGGGGSAVTIADGADVAQGTSTDASTVSSTIGLLKAIKAAVQGTLAVSGTFWQATQPVSLATNTPDVTDRAARLLGHVTVDSAPSTAVTGPLTDTQLRASAPHVIVDTAPTTAVTIASLPSGAVTTVDGGNVAQGTTSDAAWVSGSGTVIALLKKIASGGGGSAVTVADGADVALGTTTDASTANTLVGILKAIKASLAGALAVTGTFWQAVQPVSGTFWQATTACLGHLLSGYSARQHRRRPCHSRHRQRRIVDRRCPCRHPGRCSTE